MSDCPALMRPITIVAGTAKIDFHYNALSIQYSASIAVGEYADIYAVLTALGTAMHEEMEAHGVAHADAYEAGWVTLDTSSNMGKPRFYTDSSLTIDWNAANSIAPVLGFATDGVDTIDVPGYITADYQATCCWFSTRPPARDTKLAKALVAGKQQRTLSGTTIKQVSIGTHSNRRVEFVELPKEIIWSEYATGANTNRDFETFWAATRAGQLISYYPDQTSTTHAHYYMREPTDWLDDIKRPHIDVETYNFTLDLAYHGAS